MSVKISGKKLLDANDYSAIIIKETEKGFCVYVHPDKDKVPLMENSNSIKISNRLKTMNSEEKVLEIINNFLDDATIFGISDNIWIPRHEGGFHGFFASCGRQLYIQSENKALKEIFERGKNNYKTARLNFCEEEVSEYKIQRSGCSAYHKDTLDSITLYLETQRGKISDWEIDFLKEFVKSKLSNQQAYARVTATENCDKYEMCCGELKITFDSRLVLFMNTFAISHNNNIDNPKVKQLKLEGI